MRAVATAQAGILLGLYLAAAGFAAGASGAVASAGLAGAAAGALAATLWADRFGRRRSLLVLALLSAAGGAALLATSGPLSAALAACIGMLNAMGRDRGAAAILEQAALPATTTAERRTMTFAWYTALQDMGHALGSLLAGVPALLERAAELPPLEAHRWGLGAYPLLLLATVPFYLRLSRRLEVDRPSAPRRLSPPPRRVAGRLAALFAVDGVGGGLLTTALLSYFFFERFGAGTATIGALFFAARVANVTSHFGAAWLARRIGLVNTMVFTHLPSSLLLVAVAFVPSFPLAAALFLLRETLVEMDVPTRQSYAMAVVGADERTTVSGLLNRVRLAAWAVGPTAAGFAMERLSLATPLLAAAALKIAYDLLLYAAFRKVRPPEERRTHLG